MKKLLVVLSLTAMVLAGGCAGNRVGGWRQRHGGLCDRTPVGGDVCGVPMGCDDCGGAAYYAPQGNEVWLDGGQMIESLPTPGPIVE